jgi:hypothetical protein
VEDIGEIRAIFESGMREIRAVEAEWDALMAPMWENRRRVCDIVGQIARDKA